MASMQRQFPKLVPKVAATRIVRDKPPLKGLRIELDLDDDPGQWGSPQHPLADRGCVISGVDVRLLGGDAQAKALAALLVRRGAELRAVVALTHPSHAGALAVFLDGIRTAPGLVSLSTCLIGSLLEHGGVNAALDALLNGRGLRSLAIAVSDAHGLGVVARRMAAHLPQCGVGHLAIDVVHRAPKAAVLDALAVLTRPGNRLYCLNLTRCGSPWNLQLAHVLPVMRSPSDLLRLDLGIGEGDQERLACCFIDARLERNRLMLGDEAAAEASLAATVCLMLRLHLERERRIRGRLVNVLLLLQLELVTGVAGRPFDPGLVFQWLAGDLLRVMKDLRDQVARGAECEVLPPPAARAERAQEGSPASLLLRHWLGPGSILVDEDDKLPAPSGSHALFFDLAEAVAFILAEIPEFAKDDQGFEALCNDVLLPYLRQLCEVARIAPSVIGE